MSKFTEKLEDIFDGDFIITHVVSQIIIFAHKLFNRD